MAVTIGIVGLLFGAGVAVHTSEQQRKAQNKQNDLIKASQAKLTPPPGTSPEGVAAATEVRERQRRKAAAAASKDSGFLLTGPRGLLGGADSSGGSAFKTMLGN